MKTKLPMAIKTVIDTNVLVSSLSSRSVHHWVIEFLLDGEFELYVTDEILLEYEEILKAKYSQIVAESFLIALKELPNVYFCKVYYRWSLIKDPDDNKFVDCYIAAGAHYLISHDSHFSILKDIAFPKVNLVKIEEFKDTFETHK
jgi:putative PIN family toxin of toxin-antitoxin system